MSPFQFVRRHEGMDIGYARISTTSQDLDRDGLADALHYLRERDRLVVPSLDRLGRSLPDIYSVIGQLDKRGVTLISLKESIDTSTSVGRMLTGIFASLAEYEVTLMHERAAAARQARRDRGQPTGRPSKLTDEQVRYARYRKDQERESVTTIATNLGVNRATLYRALDLGSASTATPQPGQ